MSREENLADYAFNFIKEICQKFGPRYSSSKEEKEANLRIKEEFSNYLDEVNIEEFKTNPNLYPQGLIKVAIVFAGFAWIFMPLRFPLPIFSAIFMFLGIFVLITELMMIKRWIKIFFKSGISSNVWGTIKPTGDVKFRIIFEGHTDSAKMMRGLNGNKTPIPALIIFGALYLIYTPTLSIIKVIGVGVSGDTLVLFSNELFQWTIYDWIYFIPWLIMFPSALYFAYSFTGNTIVEGANDNLSGSAISAAVGKYLSENRPRNVELIIGSMGSEEIGDRGAKYFVDTHGDLLKDSYAFIIDSAGSGDLVYIVEKDAMHLTKYSQEVVERMEKAYEEYKIDNPDAIKCEKGGIPLGSSDACMYAKAGYKASFIITVAGKFNKPPHWHSNTDTWDNIKKPVLKDVIGICLKFVEIVDKEVESREPLQK